MVFTAMQVATTKITPVAHTTIITTDEDVWDAPGFTKKEFEKNLIDGNYHYYCSNKLFYLEMEKNSKNEYVCPLLSDKGCKLGVNKPFKCAIWPLYIVKINHKIALVVS